MNLAQFDNIVNRLNGIATDLDEYNGYIQQATVVPSLTLPQLLVISSNATLRITQCNTQLSDVGVLSTSQISDMITNATAAQAILAPLLTPPAANPAAIVTWITSLITLYAGPYASYTAQITEFGVQSARIATAVSNVTSALAATTNSINTAIADAVARLGG